MRCQAIYAPLLLFFISLIQGSECQSLDELIDGLFNSPIEEKKGSPEVTPSFTLNESDLTTERVLNFDRSVSDIIAERVLQFTQDLGQELVRENESSETNVVFSPTSIMSLLALLMLGARGQSYRQLRTLFEFQNHKLLDEPSKFYTEFSYLLDDLQNNDTQTLTHSRQNARWRDTPDDNRLGWREESSTHMKTITKVANGIFVQTGTKLNPDYLYTLQTLYRSTLKKLNFAAKPKKTTNYINRWVKESTFGKIPQLIKQPLSRETRMAIANTLYFKGPWKYSFLDKYTKKANFYPDGKQQPPVEMEMMFNYGSFPYFNSTKDGCRIIGLPYSDGVTTMYIIQPHKSSRSELKNLQHRMNAARIEELISKMAKTAVLVGMPKMNLSSNYDLRKTLIRLGVVDIFNSGLSDLSLIASRVKTHSNAVRPELNRTDLSKLHLDNLERGRSNSNIVKSDLFVDSILHEVKVDINETGTEAAAATTATLHRSLPGEVFRADSPFMFLIRHDPTKFVLFYGLVNRPGF